MQEKIDICKIPQIVLDTISTEELINVILEYPLIINTFAFNTIDDGLDSISSYFNGIKELESRKDSSEKLLNKLIKMEVINNISNKNDFKHVLNLTLIEGLLSRDVFYNKLSQQQLEKFYMDVEYKYYKKLNNINYYTKSISPLYEQLIKKQGKISTYDYSATVKTPMGTTVSVMFVTNDFDQSVKNYWHNFYSSTYPNAVRVGDATKKYNCHSYAWYQQSTSNTYWMDYAYSYMSDGSYRLLIKGESIKTGDKAYYKSKDHSGVVYSINGLNITLISKWSDAGLYKHLTNDCPYGVGINSEIDYYR